MRSLRVGSFDTYQREGLLGSYIGADSWDVHSSEQGVVTITAYKFKVFFPNYEGANARANSFNIIASSYGNFALLHFDKGEYVKARELGEKCVETFEKAEAKSEQRGASQYLAWVYVELGDIEKAKGLIASLRRFALEEKDRGFVANADALEGMLFRAQRKRQVSIEYFERSLREYEALNARQWKIYSLAKMVLYEYARVYLERIQEGDREKTHNLRSQALELFQKIGAEKDVEKIIVKKKLLTA